jgi:hypothetical protein
MLPHPALSKGEGSKTLLFKVLSFGEDLGEAGLALFNFLFNV